MDLVTAVPPVANEPILEYAPESPERDRLVAELASLTAQAPVDLPAVIDGVAEFGQGESFDVVAPHAHRQVLGRSWGVTERQAASAIEAARAAAPGWRELPFAERAAVMLRAAELISGPRRMLLNAATMLGQSKTAIQAEIDSAGELIDFLRYNVAFARQVLENQPESSAGVWNRMDHRPLEGFVYAVTPFNFTAIAGNLPTAPALMGNVVVWKPAPTQQLAAHFFMRILMEAGLPPGVINMLPGDGAAVSRAVFRDPDLAGIHFTGSTAVFRHFWREVADNLETYRSYPRLVGETGGKDFVLAHSSADIDVLRTALIRGAFEYQGQKCSAASRAYVPRGIWRRLADDLAAEVESLSVGPVTDLTNFAGAVIDERAFGRVTGAIDRASQDPSVTVLAGGRYDDREGWFIRPTVLVGTDPTADWFTTEYFGPLLAVHVFEDDDFDEVIGLVNRTSPYGLTGSVMATDRDVITRATRELRFAAGNFYVNDKPT
ncbi:MAG: L-glutamate gamma-semialdehyde dehydrogenase, partial [Candidatus Nanopelagicales bacterium]|nr:L-glutamate gamma-semialdehyde dehydrogenase [Candidatus Nanopelagicales bacterium]